MLLPENVLQSVRYYESKSLHQEDYKYYDIIVLHFKAFWKIRKTIKWQCVRTAGDDGNDYIKVNAEYLELKKQLDEYFQSKENDLTL